MISLIKIGGNIIDNETALEKFVADFAALPGKKILVHGGGKMASALSKKLNIEPVMIDGRRVTDKASLEVITMTYAGLINKSICAKLQAKKCNAVGVCGADGNLVPAEKRNPLPVDYGFVGDPAVENVNADFLFTLLGNGFVPVIAPVTHDGNGQLLNTNADTMAAAIGAALAQKANVQLIFCFEKKGVLLDAADENSVLPEISPEFSERLALENKIHSGMKPKLHAGFLAKSSGVTRVVIGHADFLGELVQEKTHGTLLVNS